MDKQKTKKLLFLRSKNVLPVLLVIVTIASTFFSCSANKKATTSSPYIKNNDILSYERIDPNKTQILLVTVGNIYSNALHTKIAFEAKNPDIQVIVLDITGGTGNVRPYLDCIDNGFIPDIMCCSLNSDAAAFEKYYENLSNKPYTLLFEDSVMQDISVNGVVYTLPGPSNISTMVYNKTLFQQYGWKVPETFDEFISVCNQITADTNGEIIPWIPNAKYQTNMEMALEAFSYAEVFAGLDNYKWLNDFCNGKATFKGHMEPFYDYVQKLIDNNLIKESYFSYSATTRGNEFISGKIAIYNYPAQTYKSDKYEFEFMPYPGKNKGDGYLNRTVSAYFSVPKKEKTEKQIEAIDRFLHFYSTPEGQEAFICKQLMTSNIKDMANQELAPELEVLKPTLLAGNLFTYFQFYRTGYIPNFSLYSHTKDLTTGKKTIAECIDEVDKQPYLKASDVGPSVYETIASSTEPFTMLETSELICDMYRDTTGADIGLIIHGFANKGNLMRIFPGDITKTHVTTLLPRSLGNKTNLIKVEMKGSQILEALNKPRDGTTVANAIYAFSGLKATVKPWNSLGTKYTSVTLADDSPLKADTTYTVAMWEGTLFDEFVTGNVEKFPGTWEELMNTYLKEKGTITPPKDGRIKLIWE